MRMRESVLSTCRPRSEWRGRAWLAHNRCRDGESVWALPPRPVLCIRSGWRNSAGAVSGRGGKSRKVPGFPVLTGGAWRCGGTRRIRILRWLGDYRVERGSGGCASGVGMRSSDARGEEPLDRKPRMREVASLHRSRDREGCGWNGALKHTEHLITCCLGGESRSCGERSP